MLSGFFERPMLRRLIKLWSLHAQHCAIIIILTIIKADRQHEFPPPPLYWSSLFARPIDAIQYPLKYDECNYLLVGQL